MNAKTKKTLVIVVAAVMAALIAALAVTEGLMFARINALSRQIAVLTGETELVEEGETQEDDVLIADDYWIRSTTQISDAYKKGSDAGLSDEDRETLELASAVLDEIITDGMTDYEKEKAVYDWMVEHLGFDDGSLTVVATTSQEQASPHGVLKNHTAVCVGFATTFRLFMEMLDIPCMVVHNTERYHSWDLVQLDGDWYHVDIYSAIGSGGYSYLNQSDEMMMQGEDWDIDYYPEASSLQYNSSYQNSTHVDSIYDLPKALRAAFAEGGNYWAFTFGCESEDDFMAAEVMVSELDGRSNADDSVALNGVGWLSSYSFTEYSLTAVNDEEYLLTVSYYSDDEEDGEAFFEGVDYERIDQAINEAFGEGSISVREIQNAN